MSEPQHQNNLASPLELLPKSYRLVKDNLNIFVMLYSVPALFAIWNTLNWFTDDKTTWSDERSSLTNWFGSFSGLEVSAPGGVSAGLAVLLGVVAIAFSLMQIILTLRVSQGKRPDIHAVWKEFTRKGLKLLLLVIVLGILILVGFILLIVPGVILLWRLFLAPYIMLDQDTGIEESIRRSWRLTRNHAWPIYGIILVSILFSITGAFPYLGPVMAFLLAVAYSCAPALRYQELRHTDHHTAHHAS